MACIEANEYCGVSYNILVLDFNVVGVVDTSVDIQIFIHLLNGFRKNIKKKKTEKVLLILVHRRSMRY